MPYSDALRDMAAWYVQLWAESLGKHRMAGDAGVGPTPLGALGATDQHSQVQLFMEGPGDKTSRSRICTPTSRSSRTWAAIDSASCST